MIDDWGDSGLVDSALVRGTVSVVAAGTSSSPSSGSTGVATEERNDSPLLA